MREAVGGSLLLYLIIPIIILIIIFIGFIMNYASAYRAANYVTTQLEACNANVNNCKTLPNKMNTIKESIKDKYSYMGDVKICCLDNEKGSVYRTTLNVEFELPLVGKFSPFKVKTESKTIYNVHCIERPFGACN